METQTLIHLHYLNLLCDLVTRRISHSRPLKRRIPRHTKRHGRYWRIQLCDLFIFYTFCAWHHRPHRGLSNSIYDH